jgi:putative ABC transport system ATP-binding protein
LKLSVQGLEHIYPGSAGAAVCVGRLDVESRGKVCLVGSSGSGKTTLLHIVAGILVPSSGRVTLGETDVFGLSEVERDGWRARHVGCVFQTFNLLQSLSALENLTLAQRFAGIAAEAARRRAFELLEQLKLADRAHARPAQLSAGEQQRVAIARALSKAPALVLADEPTASLDDENAAAALDLLLATSAESTLLVASHDARLIARFESVQPLVSLAGKGLSACV